MNLNNVNWTRGDMIEVMIKSPDYFLKIKETLTRIGIASHRTNTLFQTCHILHKQGTYYIVMFKEMFLLDGKRCELTLSDILRRNAIVKLLEDWDLCTVVDPSKIEQRADIHTIKVLKHSEKRDWILESKYTIGSK